MTRAGISERDNRLMADQFRLRVTSVKWPGPMGSIGVTGPVEADMLKHGAELVVVAPTGEQRARVRRWTAAAEAPPSRPGRVGKWLQPQDGLCLWLWGINRGKVTVGDAVRIGSRSDST